MKGHATPRLQRFMQTQAILSTTEARAAIRDYRNARDGYSDKELMRWGGGEAVAHYGGPLKVIKDAIKNRHVWRVYA